MLRIYKYPLRGDTPVIELPKGYQVISVINQRGVITLYAAVDPSKEAEKVQFFVVGTGWDISEEFLAGTEFISTVNCEPFVWHIFKIKKVKEKPKNGDCPVCGGVIHASNPDFMPIVAACTNCTFKSETRDNGVAIVQLNGQSFVFDPDAGPETNLATMASFEKVAQGIREEMD